MKKSMLNSRVDGFEFRNRPWKSSIGEKPVSVVGGNKPQIDDNRYYGKTNINNFDLFLPLCVTQVFG